MGATTIPCLISRLKLSEIELIIQHLSRPLHQKAIDDIKSLGPINQPSEQISHQIGALENFVVSHHGGHHNIILTLCEKHLTLP